MILSVNHTDSDRLAAEVDSKCQVLVSFHNCEFKRREVTK